MNLFGKRRSSLPVVAKQYEEHVNPAFVRVLGLLGYGRVFTRAQGLCLWDVEGRTYTDFLAGFGTNSLGHNPTQLTSALCDLLDKDLPHVLHVGPQSWAAKLGAAFAEHSHLPIALLSLSGGEAVEAALKLARAATGKKTLVYCSGGFHGTGFGNLSVLGHARWQKPFQPLVPNCLAVPYGDLDALRSVLRQRDVAAFVVEPIQGEAGVIVPSDSYLREAQIACRAHGSLFVVDEVQTGMGRTGTLFAYQQVEGLDPDMVVLGKGLGGGLLPVSATLVRREHHERAYGTMDTFDLHGSTYAGYALGCAVALHVLEAVSSPEFLARVVQNGERLATRLRARLSNHPWVRDVRGCGLLVGIELGPTGHRFLDKVAPPVSRALSKAVAQKMLGQWLAVRLLEQGFVCQPASQAWNVLKLTPPLTVTEDAIDRFVDATGSILDEYRDLLPLVSDMTSRLSSQFLAGGPFG